MFELSVHHGGTEADDARRLKQLENENAQLKGLAANRVLENLALREIYRENGEPVAATLSRGHAIIPGTDLHRERTPPLIR